MKTKNKTLIILTPAFPANESETYWVPFVQQMVRSLKENYTGINFIVLSFFYPHHISIYNWHTIKVISFDGAHKRKIRRISFWLGIWKTLKNIRKEHDVIGIFSFWCGECAFIGKRFGKKYSIKHYSLISGQDARKTNKWIKFIRPRANELAALSNSLVNEFYKNHGVKPAYIIPNAIEPGSFPKTSLANRNIDILGVGSLIPLKQYDLFTTVISSLQKKIPGIKALLCGIGDEKEKIETLINQYGIENNLQLPGGKTHEEILQLMQRTKLLLHTSSYEGFSTVCLEALYAGAHVISFCYPLDHPVPHWHVVNTAEEMTTKALEILNDPRTDHSPVLLYSMNDSARAVMRLFDEASTITINKTPGISQSLLS